ncbi:MAG: SH3 domain-containing protein [Gemmobacter sp.]
MPHSGSFFRRTAFVVAAAGLVALHFFVPHAAAQERAAPVTGPGVTTVGNIAPGSRVNLRAGPAVIFPVVDSVAFGTRVEVDYCIGGGSARWCKIDTTDGRQSGYIAGRFLVEGTDRPRPPAGDDNLDGGPDFWAVRGLPPGDRLNVRRDPSPRSPALATLREGEVVRNLGCRMSGGARWCRIRSTTGMDVTGWVAGRYLVEAAGRPPGGRPPGGGAGGAGGGSWIVAGLAPGDTLNLRAEPSPNAQVLARLLPGVRVQDLGCRQSGRTQWCRVRTTGSVDITGWVNGRYLRRG